MSDKIDYNKLGFKAGLEIHQQLDTGKLFCNCPGVLRSDEPKFEVERKLHKVAGESGKVDLAAEYQHKEDKRFVYEAYDSTCLVELDEEPPHEINANALKVATQIALLFNCKIIPVSQIMRKTVINGSNTSGFQRTVMFARDGYIETSKGRVGINSLFLEEDSARPIERGDDFVRYRLDRLGIPLVEITTDPDLKDAEHVKEAAMIIGDILRSCKVRRGIGTIRQDLNISIEGSNRVEIKGFQDPKIMVETVNNEIIRQKGLMDLSKEVDSISVGEIKVIDDLKSEIGWIKKSLENGFKFVGFKVENFKGVFGRELFSGFRVGTEIARYAKPRGFGGVIHADEDLSGKYKFSKENVSKIKEQLNLKENDSFMMVLGDEKKAEAMFREVLIPRLKKLVSVNPKEVRNSLADSTTEFSRPMPGAARMYPETDLELLKLNRNYVNLVKSDLPELRSSIEKRLRKDGLTEDMLSILFKRDLIEKFKEVSVEIKAPSLIGKAMLLLPKEISTKSGVDLDLVEEKLSSDVLTFVLGKIVSGDLDEGDLKEVLERIIKGEDLKKAVKVEKVDLSSVEDFVRKVVKEKPGLRPNAYMGLVMKEFKGKVNAGQVMGIISKLV